MTDDHPLTELTACPRCDKAPLTATSNGLRCDGCKIDFPSVDGVPWLFAEPESSLGEWRNRLHFALQQLGHQSQRMQSELKETEADSLTAERLKRLIEGADAHRNALRSLLSPVDIHSTPASYESYLAMRTRLPADQGIATYYANIHRDWVWGDAENQASIDQIVAVAGEKPLGDTLVLGAGASRLAYDVHRQLNTDRTIATDFNPLLILTAKKVTEGNDVELYEFPIAPKSIEDVAVRRMLTAPEPADDRFLYVLSDALRPPFGRATFDTVITPWLIDVIGEDLPVQAARINHLLKPGGRWINFGSLTFDHPDARRRYSTEETIDIVGNSGFDTPETVEADIPYMCSPASRHGRRESVFTFAATKTGDVKVPERHKSLPDWVVTGKEPVPALETFRSQAVSTQIHAYIMSLIDGKRTIEDMAKILQQQNLMSEQEALPALRNFMTRMFDDSQRSSGF